MSLSEKLDGILAAHEARTETSQALFGKLIGITQEMAKRIEALEERLDAKERARGYIHFPDQG